MLRLLARTTSVGHRGRLNLQYTIRVPQIRAYVPEVKDEAPRSMADFLKRQAQLREAQHDHDHDHGHDHAELSDSEDEGPYENPITGEIGGPKGPEPTRYGDWERGGRISDF